MHSCIMDKNTKSSLITELSEWLFSVDLSLSWKLNSISLTMEYICRKMFDVLSLINDESIVFQKTIKRTESYF
jgi:hypothetical protein